MRPYKNLGIVIQQLNWTFCNDLREKLVLLTALASLCIKAPLYRPSENAYFIPRYWSVKECLETGAIVSPTDKPGFLITHVSFIDIMRNEEYVGGLRLMPCLFI
jgi:hypothetical protein